MFITERPRVINKPCTPYHMKYPQVMEDAMVDKLLVKGDGTNWVMDKDDHSNEVKIVVNLCKIKQTVIGGV
jgi:hypothetical protein